MEAAKPAFLQDLFTKWVYNPLARSFSTISGQFWNTAVFGTDTFADERINEYTAHRIATVYTCINVRSQTIAALPMSVFREDKKTGRKEGWTDHPVYYPLAHEPNDYLTSANFFQTCMIHADSWGNSYALITRDDRGNAIAYEILEPFDVEPVVVEGKAFYKYYGDTIPGREVLHFRWFSYDGLCGESPIRMNANTFGMALKQDRYSALALGTKPPGFLSYEGDLKPEQKKQNQQEWDSPKDLGKTKVLSGRWKYTPIMIPPDDAQYIEAKKLTKQEIYGIYRIPPTFAQDFERATFANAEQQDLVFVKHTITPLIRQIEQEINKKCFTERDKKTHYVKFNLNGLLRGDLAARQAFYQSMVNSGVMNRNEARGFEELNAYQGGDDFLVQGAMVPADLLRKQYEQKVLPTVEPPQPGKTSYTYSMNGNGSAVH